MKEKKPSPCGQCKFKSIAKEDAFVEVMSSLEKGYSLKCSKNHKFYCVSYCEHLYLVSYYLLHQALEE